MNLHSCRYVLQMIWSTFGMSVRFYVAKTMKLLIMVLALEEPLKTSIFFWHGNRYLDLYE
ncbi:hypothetical protein BCY89_13860 [Sphingobacterium siyangense]|uniref:Uncharacterized protein n=1 Tax=Sphingobacterium siyangense TaxID=459529 RepID=A0A420FHE0_9SPHI|nr:hypothetical protein BCY89_13860 [Sphingobacterium siyangense]